MIICRVYTSPSLYGDLYMPAQQEHEKVVRRMASAALPLLKPHLEAMEARLRPGATVLTWASMNIDGYLHFAHQASHCQLEWMI